MRFVIINIFSFFISLCLSNYVNAQLPSFYFQTINVDSLIISSVNPVVFMDEVLVFNEPVFRSKADQRRYSKLVRNFLHAYPYAKLMGATMQDIENNLRFIDSENAKKRYIKMREKRFRDKYEDNIKQMTISQGLLLIKLIDRETGNTGYDIIKEFRGGVLAGTSQAIARLFGHNLKIKYDPQNEDRYLEILVLKYENGQL
jgi:hypothetical protein